MTPQDILTALALFIVTLMFCLFIPYWKQCKEWEKEADLPVDSLLIKK